MSEFLHCSSANRGACLQPCRRKYKIVDPEDGHELIVEDRYVMSPEDLCTLPILDKLVGVVDVMKVEGRGRDPRYVKTIIECYREAIDLAVEGKLDDSVKERLTEKARSVFNRGFSTGFYMGVPLNKWARAYGSQATVKKRYAGRIIHTYKKAGAVDVKLDAEGLKVGDTILISGERIGAHEQKVESLRDDEKRTIREARKGELVGVKVIGNIENFRTGDKVFLLEEA